MKIIVYYEYRLRPSSRVRRCYLRAEYAPNTAQGATVFDTVADSEEAADIVRANQRAMGRDVRFTFQQEGC